MIKYNSKSNASVCVRFAINHINSLKHANLLRKIHYDIIFIVFSFRFVSLRFFTFYFLLFRFFFHCFFSILFYVSLIFTGCFRYFSRCFLFAFIFLFLLLLLVFLRFSICRYSKIDLMHKNLLFNIISTVSKIDFFVVPR